MYNYDDNIYTYTLHAFNRDIDKTIKYFQISITLKKKNNRNGYKSS